MNKHKNFSYIYNMYREQILYVVFGVLTTAVSIIVYAAFTEWIKLNFLIANIISWIVAVMFAFVTNRTWVFKSNKKTAKDLFSEMGSFYIGRLLTLGIEEVLLLFFINILSLPNMPVKISVQVIVIILNYFISKFMIFKK